MNQSYYTIKDSGYFTHVRKDIISLVPNDANQKILEIGAGSGNTILYLKENKLAAEVTGVELINIPGSNQQHPAIDRFLVANIETDAINVNENYFDTIICADVLEHLADPWTVVDKISRYLKPNGILIISIPNIREVKTISQILFKADFKYEAAGGILDKTHLRFFCKKNIHQLLTTKDLSVIYSTPNFLLKSVPEGKKRRIINLLTLGLFTDLLTVQYIFIARKK